MQIIRTKNQKEFFMTQTTFIKKLAGIFLLALILCQAGYSKPTPEEIKKQTSLLFQAVRGKDVEMAKSCIKEGADVNGIEKEETNLGRVFNYTPLYYAILKNHEEMVNLLIKSKANINAVIDNRGDTLLMEAIRFHTSSITHDNKAYKLLLNAKVDVDAKDKFGSTALHHVVFRDDPSNMNVVYDLIDAGANVNATDNDGLSVLEVAKLNKADIIVSILKAAGAK